MNVSDVILVLGKRLHNNKLTAEGRSRVDALISLLASVDCTRTALVFCGGITPNQTNSEAREMYEYFMQSLPNPQPVLPEILLEDRSVNTIENVINAADTLIESKLCQTGQQVTVHFVSNDYHLKRIFEIQSLMDEQGLLRVLKSRCALSGLDITIPIEHSAHTYVPYPHTTEQGNVFLLLDELTTYRVYLEGVKRGAFDRPLNQVRAEPLKIASKALKKLLDLELGKEVSDELEVIKRAVEMTTPDLPYQELAEQLLLLDTTLTQLNRTLDPERQNV
ncbi:YdcF family protein [Vibrio aquaticus]|uniref:YdcF family protein n=1 Tax=Vibrio aquaticus TaxID=2496559 RepID=A0A432D0Z8_9VIBR|nr:YdcF family protein [Vibrio aquaticus]RTZ17576.1 YdcF family protein [Vibrio aquaticus]